MSVDRAEVERVAGLARIAVDESGVERMVADMNQVLEYAERLRDVAGEPEAVADEIAPAQRADRGDASMSGVRAGRGSEPDRLERPPSSFAPDWRSGFFAVPPPPGVSAEDEEA